VATASGASILYAVRGGTGADLPHFPIRLASAGQGSVHPPVLLLDLHARTAALATAALAAVPAADSALGSGSAPQLRGRRRRHSNSSSSSSSSSEGGDREGSAAGAADAAAAAELRARRGQGRGPAPLGGFASGLHLVFPTHDGGLHVVEGGSGCLNRVELGERVYAMPVADDVQVGSECPWSSWSLWG
jgi:hypothetical protein